MKQHRITKNDLIELWVVGVGGCGGCGGVLYDAVDTAAAAAVAVDTLAPALMAGSIGCVFSSH